MRLSVVAVGRLKAGAERELCGRYAVRLKTLAPKLGMSFTGAVEIAESAAPRAPDRMAQEAGLLAAKLPAGALSIVLDERGKAMTSEAFANWIAQRRDQGQKSLAFIIGGPDGLDESLRRQAGLVLSFGGMTLPHQIVRALVLEQLYRAAAILSGHPYHRA